MITVLYLQQDSELRTQDSGVKLALCLVFRQSALYFTYLQCAVIKFLKGAIEASYHLPFPMPYPLISVFRLKCEQHLDLGSRFVRASSSYTQTANGTHNSTCFRSNRLLLCGGKTSEQRYGFVHI